MTACPNGVEYFMDAPDGFTENPGVVNGKVTWSRVNPVASFKVQVSDNLTGWTIRATRSSTCPTRAK